MKKRVVSILVTVVVLASNFSKIEIGAAGNEQTAELYAVTLDAPEEEVLYIPEGTVRIEDNEFDGYGTRWNAGEGDYATKIVLPSTLEYIGKNAFASSCIEEILIPGNVKEIDDDAFWSCDNLKKVVIEDGVEKMGCALFRDCSNLETVILPKAVKEWNTECAFYNCKIKNITLPEEGLTTLGSGMFAGCPLEELNIPDCVTTMNYGVTQCCNNIKVIRAGYSVVNFEEGNPKYDLYNFTDDIFGLVYKRNPDVVLEAPLDSAIVEYARKYCGIQLKYDYPDVERIEYICNGKITEYNDNSTVEVQAKAYPDETMYILSWVKGLNPSFPTESGVTDRTYGQQIWSGIITGVSNKNNSHNICKIYIDGGLFPGQIKSQYFLWKYYTQDENLEYAVENTNYFKVTVSYESLKNQEVQVEILKSGEWDSEDAEWELLTPEIDTTVLTPTPTAMPTKAVTPNATTTPKPEKITAEVPTVTAAPTSKPAITKKVTPTPGVKAVKPAKTSIKSAKQTVVKKHGKKVYKKEVKLSWKKVKNADGYVICMKNGTGKYKAVKTIANGKTVSYTKKNLKKGRTYYFKVRAYHKVNGQKVYGSYSSVKKVKIK